MLKAKQLLTFRLKSYELKLYIIIQHFQFTEKQ